MLLRREQPSLSFLPESEALPRMFRTWLWCSSWSRTAEAERRCSEITGRWSKATRMVGVAAQDRGNLRAAKEASEIMAGRYAW
jgi:hypothetical protein